MVPLSLECIHLEYGLNSRHEGTEFNVAEHGDVWSGVRKLYGCCSFGFQISKGYGNGHFLISCVQKTANTE